jgi:patatin-like phospholipase/acyl hydrolase
MLRYVADPAANGARESISLLALSGGGGDGAYGAGILNGWSATGTRPTFTIVTGVSTGALIAPFAFLGPRYDRVIRDAYTDGSARHFLGAPDILGILFGPALFSNGRLRQTVVRYIDERVLREIAREHAKGRRLYVVTTNLDLQRAVVWDMGAIAAGGSPEALALFRDVMLASASVPLVFPPVLIEASANGRSFEEMHVDGGAIAPLYTLPEMFRLHKAEMHAGEGAIYILLNAKFAPSFAAVEDNALAIARRAASTFTKTEAKSIVLDSYDFAREAGVDFKITYIDEGQPDAPESEFDTAHMRQLYRYGYDKARAGDFWEPAPPATPSDSIIPNAPQTTELRNRP